MIGTELKYRHFPGMGKELFAVRLFDQPDLEVSM